jgi:hypothetical protein
MRLIHSLLSPAFIRQGIFFEMRKMSIFEEEIVLGKRRKTTALNKLEGI